MAEVTGLGLKGIVAGMMEQARSATQKDAPTGVVGQLYEKATGETDRYNKALENNKNLRVKQRRTVAKLARKEEELLEIQNQLTNGLIKGTKEVAKAKRKMEELSEAVEDLSEDNEHLSDSLNQSKQDVEAMAKGTGIFRNGLTTLAAKTLGAATAMFSWRDAMHAVTHASKLAVNQMGELGEVTGGYGETLGRVATHAHTWEVATTQTTWELAKLGYTAEETHGIMDKVASGLRLTTTNQQDLAAVTAQTTKDISFVSNLLRVDTETLASATTEASKKFGKSGRAFTNDLAGMFDAIQQVKLGSKDSVVNIEDLSRATLEAQGSFQGYNFNLRQTARVMSSVVARAQEQGATYEMAMNAAKGLSGVLTEGKAPDWAKFTAGKELRNELIQVVQAARESGTSVREAIIGSFGKDLSEKQLKGLENMADNWQRYGKLSSAKMTEELLRGTEKGSETMFKMLKKHADKPEGRELLMRVWGLDEAAATAAILALDTAKGMDDLIKIQDKAKRETARRRPPTVADLRRQTDAYVQATRDSAVGIMGKIIALGSAIRANPMVSGAIGGAGALGTAGLEIAQTGMAASALRKLSETRGGAAAGKVAGKGAGLLSRGTAFLGLSKAAEAAQKPFLKMAKPLQALAGKGGFAGLLGKVGLLAGKGGMLGLAAGVGVAIGSLLRLIPGVDDFAEGAINAGAKLLGFEHAVDSATETQNALNQTNQGVQKANEQMLAGALAFDRKNSYDRMVAIRQLQGLNEEQIDTYATKIAETGELKKEQAKQRLLMLQNEKVTAEEFTKARTKHVRGLSQDEIDRRVTTEARGQVGPRGSMDLEKYQARVAKTEAKLAAMYAAIRAPKSKRATAPSKSKGGGKGGVRQKGAKGRPNGDIEFTMVMDQDAFSMVEEHAAGYR